MSDFPGLDGLFTKYGLNSLECSVPCPVPSQAFLLQDCLHGYGLLPLILHESLQEQLCLTCLEGMEAVDGLGPRCGQGAETQSTEGTEAKREKGRTGGGWSN